MYCLVVCEVSETKMANKYFCVPENTANNSPMENNGTFKQAYFGLRPARSVKVEGVGFDPQ